MAEIRVQPNLIYLQWYSVFMALCGVIIIGGHAYYYAVGQLAGDWYFSFYMGAFALVIGAGYLSGYINPNIAEIVIDETGINSSKSLWDSSLKWDNLKKVELQKDRIQVQYSKTGLTNKIIIPLMIRFSSEKMQTLEKGLLERCSMEGVEFESNLKTKN